MLLCILPPKVDISSTKKSEKRAKFPTNGLFGQMFDKWSSLLIFVQEHWEYFFEIGIVKDETKMIYVEALYFVVHFIDL